MTTQIPSADDFLDRAIHAITSQPTPAFERERAIDRALTTHASRRRPTTTPLTPFRAALIRWAIAAAFFIVAGTMVLPMLNNARKFSANGYANKEVRTPAAPQVTQQADTDKAAYKVRLNSHILVAEKASVIIASGPATELKLGAEVPANQTVAVHAWDWNKSPTSRIVPDADASKIWHAALSPNGSLLVEASGKIHQLIPMQPGEIIQNALKPRTSINLGGGEIREGDSIYNRIGEMRFSPDGLKLAMLVTLRNPDKSIRDVIQVVDFASEKVLCEFPAGEAYALRIALSNDGKHIASADPQRKLSLRDCETGKVVREFDPPFNSQVMSIALSPDGKQIVANDRSGALIAWSTDTGKMLWQTDITKLPRSPGGEPVGLLHFSPDGRFIAGRRSGKVNVFDASTGQAQGSISAQGINALEWSDDSKSITLITTGVSREDPPTAVYPTVQKYDWRIGKAITAP